MSLLFFLDDLFIKVFKPPGEKPFHYNSPSIVFNNIHKLIDYVRILVRKALFKLQILDHYRATHYLGFKCIHVKILLRF